MVLHRIIIQAIVQGARYGGKSLYTTLRFQDRIIDKTYRKAGLYNRGVVKGIQHGLVAGQIIGGTLNLGLPEGIDDGTFQKRPSPGRSNKKRQRVQRYSRRSNKYCRPRNFRRRR